MAQKFSVSIITPNRIFFEGETEMIILKGDNGYFAVMYDFEPSVIPLAIGSLKIKGDDGVYSVAACSAGLLTVRESKATILLGSAEWIDEIDLERALEAKKRAEERLIEASTREDIDYIRAKAALERAINRIRLGESRR